MCCLRICLFIMEKYYYENKMLRKYIHFVQLNWHNKDDKALPLIL
jgi:hypothetical protein